MSEFGYEPEKVGFVRGLQRSFSRERIVGGADSNGNLRGGGLLTRTLSGDKLLDRRRSSRMPRREVGLTRSISGDRLTSSQRPGLTKSGGSRTSLRNLLGGLGNTSNHGNGENTNATWGGNSGHKKSGGSIRNLFQGMSKNSNNSDSDSASSDGSDSDSDGDSEYDRSLDGEEEDYDDDYADGNRRSALTKSKKKNNSFRNLVKNPLSRSFSNLNNSRNSTFCKNEIMDEYDGVDVDQLEKECRGKKRLENREQTLLLLCKELGLMDE